MKCGGSNCANSPFVASKVTSDPQWFDIFCSVLQIKILIQLSIGLSSHSYLNFIIKTLQRAPALSRNLLHLNI